MRLSMLKLLTVTALLSSSLSANSSEIDKKVLKFEKNRISKNKQIQLKDIKLFLKKDLKQDGWYGYTFNLKIIVPGKNIPIEVKDTIFASKNMISPELINVKNNVSYKRLMYPKLSTKYFADDFLVVGNKNAEHKITIFSDPLCPNCTSIMPEIISDIKKYPNKIALYYVHMPLDMHPMAKLLVKASSIAKKQGIKDIDYKVYTANFEKSFDPYEEKDENKVLKIFNNKFNTNITMKQINSKELNDELEHHLQLSNDALIQGTPTIFFDGEIDPMRNKYKRYIK